MKKEPVHEQFLANALAYPDRIAVERGEERITYRELERRGKALALTIQRLGLPPESPVAIYSADSCHTITAILGSLMAGVAFVPLDPDMPRGRLRHMIGQARPQLYLVESALAAEASALIEEGTPGVPLRCFEEIDIPTEELTQHQPVSWNPDGMCYVYFTSGSTGEAKGIAGRLKGVGHFIHWETETLGLTSGVKVSQLTLPSFDPFLRDSFVALCNGGTICVPDSRETVLDPSSFLAWLDRSGVEVIHCVPTLFRLILQAGPTPDRLQALKYILLAGEVLPPEDCAAFFAIFGERIGLINLYGPSETTMVKLFHRVTLADCSRKSIPIGKPMAGARALLMDARMKPTPPKSVGEIYIRTPYRSLGYINRPDLTASVFVANPFSNDPNDMIYKTGDYARMLDDESYEFLGRMDNQIKIRGVRIEPIEIESVIAQHPAVQEGVVAGKVVGTGSDAVQQLVAYVVGKSGTLDLNELRAFLQERLPNAMVPSQFMELDKLPRTLQGKVDRKALPTPKSERESAFYVAPRTPVEELIAAIWADVLHRDRIGIYDNFFALGGHSLLATQVVIRLRHTFQVDLRLTKIFNTPTVAQMAAFIERERTAGQMPSEPTPVDRSGDLPLSFVQQQLWFMDRLAPGSSYYNLPVSLRFEGRIDLRLLTRCLEQLVQRHEMLRTVFHETLPGQPVQKVLEATPEIVTMVDLSQIEGKAREQVLQAMVERAERRGFDLGQLPLLRLVIVRESAERHAVQLTMHHIVGDGWSIHVLFEDLLALYRAQVQGQQPALPPLQLQYGDYAHWQRQWQAQEAQELAHWRDTLQGAPELFGLPPDHPRPETFTNRGRRARAVYPVDLVTDLSRLGRQQDTTLFMTLTAGFLALLRWHSKSDDLVIGSDFANRQHLATERLIGCFVNQLPLRVQSEGSLSFKDLLSRTREVFLAAYAHQELPFIKLVESLRPRRQAAFGPLFQTKLVLQPPAVDKGSSGGLVASAIKTEHTTAQLDLILNMSETEKGLEANLEYCTDLYEASTIQRFLQELELVWRRVCATPEIRLDEIDQMLERERQERQAAQREQEKASAGARLDKFKRRGSGAAN